MSKKRLRQTTILAADNDRTSLEVIRGIFENQGVTVVTAERGYEALEKAKSLRPDVVLLDVMIPDIYGFELCQRMRAIAHLEKVPILMVTCLDDPKSRRLAVEAGANGLIPKPIDRNDLRTRVESLLKLSALGPASDSSSQPEPPILA